MTPSSSMWRSSPTATKSSILSGLSIPCICEALLIFKCPLSSFWSWQVGGTASRRACNCVSLCMQVRRDAAPPTAKPVNASFVIRRHGVSPCMQTRRDADTRKTSKPLPYHIQKRVQQMELPICKNHLQTFLRLLENAYLCIDNRGKM